MIRKVSCIDPPYDLSAVILDGQFGCLNGRAASAARVRLRFADPWWSAFDLPERLIQHARGIFGKCDSLTQQV